MRNTRTAPIERGPFSKRAAGALARIGSCISGPYSIRNGGCNPLVLLKSTAPGSDNIKTSLRLRGGCCACGLRAKMVIIAALRVGIQRPDSPPQAKFQPHFAIRMRERISMKVLRRATVAVLVLTLMLCSAVRAQGLKQLPANPLVVIKMNNPEGISKKLADWSQKLGLANFDPAFGNPLAALKKQLNIKDGPEGGLDGKGEVIVGIYE